MTQAMRFDSYCTRYGIENVDLIKIDVEGAELKVLQGMGMLLDKWRPDIICEVLAPYTDALNQFFDGTRYQKYLIGDNELIPQERLVPNAQFRDYYLTCEPLEKRL